MRFTPDNAGHEGKHSYHTVQYVRHIDYLETFDQCKATIISQIWDLTHVLNTNDMSLLADKHVPRAPGGRAHRHINKGTETT